MKVTDNTEAMEDTKNFQLLIEELAAKQFHPHLYTNELLQNDIIIKDEAAQVSESENSLSDRLSKLFLDILPLKSEFMMHKAMEILKSYINIEIAGLLPRLATKSGLIEEYARFPFKHPPEQWFSLNAIAGKKFQLKCSQAKSYFLNIPDPCANNQGARRIIEILQCLDPILPESALYFHSTTHQGALQILQENILVSGIGRAEMLDFSDGKGFYLGKDLTQIIDKTRARIFRRSFTGQAVLVYSLQSSILRGRIGLDFYIDQMNHPESRKNLSADQDKHDLWDQVIRFFRYRPSRTTDCKGLQDYLENQCEFIRGPWCVNPEEARTGKVKPEGWDIRQPGKELNPFESALCENPEQLCILGQEMADVISNKLLAVIFFPTIR